MNTTRHHLVFTPLIAAFFFTAAAFAPAGAAPNERPTATAKPSQSPTTTTPSRQVRPAQQGPRIQQTKIQIIEGSGEFEFLKDEIVVAEQVPVKIQWTTQRTDAVAGLWMVRNANTPSVIIASGKVEPAPAPGHMHRFTIAKTTFLAATPPAADMNYEITVQALNAADEYAGAVSNTVRVKQLAGSNIAPPTVFTSSANFPDVEMISLDENVAQIPLTQLYSTEADLTLRVTNNTSKKTDSVFLSVSDGALLFRRNQAPIIIPELSPQASMTVTMKLEAILPPAQSQTPQRQQVRSWRQTYANKCGPELRSVLDWRGPQGQSPIDPHRERLLAKVGWSDYTKIPPSVPICDATQCVRICDIEKSIKSRLDGRTVGYSYVLGRDAPKFGAAGLARTDADGAEIAFTSRTPITVASVAKMITAIGAMSVINTRRNVDLTDTAGDFYPDEWNVGAYFQNVSLARFLGQISGIKDYGNVPLTYAKLQGFFEQPVNNSWMPACMNSSVIDPPNAVNPNPPAAMASCYSNYNFAIFRVLLPAIAGLPIDSNLTTRPATLANQYELLVRQNVFERVGQTGTGCRPRGALPHAFAYKFPGNQPGTDWGDVRGECGGAGWYVSAEDMAKVLFSINSRDGKILREDPAAMISDIQTMRQFSLGLDTATGQEMSKNGAWGSGGNLITSGAAIFGPVSGPNVVGVLFINSEISGGPNSGENALNVLRDAYNASVYTK